MSIPRVVPSSQLAIFKFYDNYEIHEAILYGNTIMRLAKVLPAENRDEAYQFACKLSQQYTTLLSPCPNIYRIWVDIRCRENFQMSFRLEAMLENVDA